MSQLPDVPTFTEAGLPAFAYDSWFGIMAPAGTPKAIVDKISQDVAAALQAPDMKARFDPQGAELVSSTPGKVRRGLAQRHRALRGAVPETARRLTKARRGRAARVTVAPHAPPTNGCAKPVAHQNKQGSGPCRHDARS